MIALFEKIPAFCPQCGERFSLPPRSRPKVEAGMPVSHHCGLAFVVIDQRWLMTAANSAHTTWMYQNTDVGLVQVERISDDVLPDSLLRGFGLEDV